MQKADLCLKAWTCLTPWRRCPQAARVGQQSPGRGARKEDRGGALRDEEGNRGGPGEDRRVVRGPEVGRRLMEGRSLPVELLLKAKQ